jgi:hypothetical protein
MALCNQICNNEEITSKGVVFSRELLIGSQASQKTVCLCFVTALRDCAETKVIRSLRVIDGIIIEVKVTPRILN